MKMTSMITRRQEHDRWNIVGECDEWYIVQTIRKEFRLIRKSDYQALRCYPSGIPSCVCPEEIMHRALIYGAL